MRLAASSRDTVACERPALYEKLGGPELALGLWRAGPISLGLMPELDAGAPVTDIAGGPLSGPEPTVTPCASNPEA